VGRKNLVPEIKTERTSKKLEELRFPPAGEDKRGKPDSEGGREVKARTKGKLWGESGGYPDRWCRVRFDLLEESIRLVKKGEIRVGRYSGKRNLRGWRGG